MKQAKATPLIAKILVITCFTLLPRAQGVVPAPDGGYPNFNTAEGQNALLRLTTGANNTAVGWSSLGRLTTVNLNTGLGTATLLFNTADANTATGTGALLSNTTGSLNTANGAFTLFSNTTGSNNTAIGLEALLHNTTNNNNTAVGSAALSGNTTGGGNTAVGDEALAVSTTGSDNVALGSEAGLLVSTASGVISIGHPGANVDNTTWISNIYGTPTVSGTTLPVIVSNNGQLGTPPSSGRFKKEIKPMDKASESILALNPVTFQYKSDKTGMPQFGLIAEDVARVNPDLIVRDKDGEIYTVRYDAVNVMLLNEFLKEHRMVQEQQKEIDSLKAELKEQRTLIQKVSAQLEVSKSAPQTVVNNR
jgi:hypothetical protein